MSEGAGRQAGQPELLVGKEAVVEAEDGGQLPVGIRAIHDRYLVLAVLPASGPVCPPAAGQIVRIYFSDPSGRWMGAARLLQTCGDEGGDLVVERPSSWERTQRRRYYRLPVELPLLWAVDRPGTRPRWQSAVSRDLSGGGISFVAAGIRQGDRVRLRVAIGSEELALEGEAVRVSPLNGHGAGAAGTSTGGSSGESSAGMSIVGVRFVGLSPRTEERLIRYLFQVESARRQLRGAR